MDNDEYLSFNKDLYDKELDGRDRILSRSSISIAILTSYTGALVYIIQRLNISAALSFDTLSICFILLAIATLLPYVIAVSYMVSVYGGVKGHSYHMLPTASIIDSYKKELDGIYVDYDGLASQHFYNYLLNEYQKCASNNAINNDERGKQLQRCTAWSFVAVLPLIALFFVFSFSSLNMERNDKKTVIYHVDSKSELSFPPINLGQPL